MAIEAVVFDIGNVLVEWQPERFYDAVIGKERRQAMFASVDLHDMNDKIDQGFPFRETVSDCAKLHPEWQSEIMMWHDNWRDLVTPEISRSVQINRALRAKGIATFILSNIGVETWALARREYPFLTEFDRSYVSGHLRMVKPHAEIYDHVERDCGIAPDRLIFADDRQDNIDAASRRGWKTHLFTDPGGWEDRLISEGLLARADIA